MRLAFLLILSIVFTAYAQDASKKRTRTVDYTQYDQLISSLAYAPDKLKASKRLLEISDALFTPEDEEYFSTRKMVAVYYEQGYDNTRAIELTQEALDAYEKNYPFYNRNGYATVTPDYALYSYLDLSRNLRTLNLFEKAIKYLESKKALLDGSSTYYIRQQFYSEYAQALLGAERYEEAIKVGLQLKDLTESGALAMNMQSADDIFKIRTTDPPEVQEQMKKAKEQYEKSMKQSQESVLSSQRLGYNMVLGNAYYKQFRFAESVPYLKATSDEMRKLMDYSRKAMTDAKAQMSNYNLPDSVKKSMEQSSDYLNKITAIGGSSALLVISASKSNQLALANQYANGQLEKAVLYQVTNQLPQAEQQYQAAFNAMKELSNYKFFASVEGQMRKGFLPLYLNLAVQSGRLPYAYEESKKVLNEEEALLKRSFQFFSESEKKEFFKAYNQKLERFYSLLFLMIDKKDNRAGEMLDKILQTKGVILDATREQEKLLKKIKDKTVVAQIGQIRKLRAKVATFYQLSLKAPSPTLADSINKTSIRINDLERKVNEKLGAIADLLKPVNWKEIQAKLKPNAVYIEMLRLPRDNFMFDKPLIQYWVFVVKPGETSPILFKLSEGEAFEGRALKNYQNRIKSQLEDVDSYKTYWAGIADHLNGAKEIIFSGDGVYHILNPLTLRNEQTGKYLVNEITLTRVSTGRDMLIPVTLASANKEIALVGNPAFAMSRKGGSNLYKGNEFEAIENDGPLVRSGMMDLPGTQKEVESIQTMAMNKGIKTNIRSGNQATEAEVKNLKNQQILHLATHGEFDQLSQADSYLKAKLILAGAGDSEPFLMSDYSKYEDGFLTAYEVTQLELSLTNLVVLSACETGTGEIQSGEGVWGLQRAFQLAGAKTVMGSLWKISDEATVVFMEAFYKKYFTGAGINASYIAAMEATMMEYSHPYYWGAFTLTGLN